MLYVMTADWHPNLDRQQRDEILMRRAAWQYPAGMKVHGEYWLAGEPAIVTVFETDDTEVIVELQFTWHDAFDVSVRPAVTAEEGLEIGPGILERRT